MYKTAWMPLVPAGLPADWNATTRYFAGDLVTRDGLVFYAKSANTDRDPSLRNGPWLDGAPFEQHPECASCGGLMSQGRDLKLAPGNCIVPGDTETRVPTRVLIRCHEDGITWECSNGHTFGGAK